MRIKVDVSYVTTLPLLGNAPRVLIRENPEEQFTVKFYDGVKLFKEVNCNGGEEVYAQRQWFTRWKIEVLDKDGKVRFTDRFEPIGKVMFIKMDAYALGDNIAWIQAVEDFRRRHNCKVICSTFWNNLFIDSFPDILFVEPNTIVHNVYAQYYIGAHENDGIYSPISVDESPLQDMAIKILGLDSSYDRELSRPYIGEKYYNMEPRIKGRYVCLSEHASGPEKYWRAKNGWQDVVDFFNALDIQVAVVSKEPTKLKNVIDLTGDDPIEERMLDIFHAECYLGVSSGLAWLAWALNTKVVMISDGTPIWHEFSHNCIRLSENNLEKIDYTYPYTTSSKKVIKSLVGCGFS